MIKKSLVLTLITFFSCGLYSSVFAVPANPNIIKEKQPDGTSINIKLCGDEFFSWYEDTKGYTVIKDTQTKTWFYAQKNGFGALEPSQNVVGKANPLNLNIKKALKDENKLFKAKQLRRDYDNKLQKTLASYSKAAKSDNSVNSESYKPAIGNKTNFVLLVQFSDLKFSDNPPFIGLGDSEIIQGFNNLFNKTGYKTDGAVGSVKDYFNEITYGQLQYNSVFSPIVTLDESYLDFAWSQGSDVCVAKVKEMIRKTLQKLDEEGYDFKSIWPDSNIPEGFSVVHAGGGAESGNHNFIWSHKSSIEPITLDGITFSNYHTEPAGRGTDGNEGIIRIGVICHESLHFFGLPDLYDTTYLTGGLGDFCVMSGGEWNGASGNIPCHPSAWCKYKLGLIDCQTAVEGVNSIAESASNSNGFYIFKPATFDEREYFLMENRQGSGFDKDIPGNKRGVLIYHVDERQSGNDLVYNTNYLVQLEEAGSNTSNWRYFPLMTKSTEGLDSDFFRNNTISYFSDDCKSSPNSKSYDGVDSGIKISGISSSSSLMSFIYGKDVIIVDGLNDIVCYPNPARNGEVNIINIPTMLEDFSVEIFTLTSKLVRSFSSDAIEFPNDGFGRIKWDCKNDSGEDVAAGVYFVLIKNISKKRVMKVAVIR